MSTHETVLLAAKRALLEAALNYARAKTFNAVLNNGVWKCWGLSDAEMYHKHYLSVLENSAIRLLQELTSSGAGEVP